MIDIYFYKFIPSVYSLIIYYNNIIYIYNQPTTQNDDRFPNGFSMFFPRFSVRNSTSMSV